ncbi:MAG: alpha/beta hydrolase [Lysobacterales bacterium]
MAKLRMNDWRTWLIFSCFVLMSACAGKREMMPTPNLHVEEGTALYEGLPEDLQSTQVPVYYVTDRMPERTKEGNLGYGYDRSASLAFGRAVVNMGDEITWQDLLSASRTQSRTKSVHLEMLETTELARAPNSPLPFNLVDGKVVQKADKLAELEEATATFHASIAKQLEQTSRKEVFIFVHGFHNSFEDSVFIMAEMWHFLGRIGVPIAYSWPAGHPGLFGYTYDRESSEFTVFHLRQLLKIIAGFPEVERINLIGHSRGTDVVVTAVRELTIAARAAGLNPQEKYKIHNLVLAAPDLDLQVATQRIAGDRLSLSSNRMTVYTSPKDKAIGLSAKIFDSPRGRVGQFGIDNIPVTVGDIMEYAESNFAVINFSGLRSEGGGGIDHSYFRKVPSVSSDLILMLRDDLEAGSPGRPLESIGHKFWKIPKGYPAD